MCDQYDVSSNVMYGDLFELKPIWYMTHMVHGDLFKPIFYMTNTICGELFQLKYYWCVVLCDV